MSQQVVYEIDDRDRIVAFGSEWLTFADANGGARLQPPALVGRSLFEFIADETVRNIYRAVIAKARSGRPVRFRYRCDAPTRRREFDMTVAASGPARVTFVSTLVRDTLRPAIPLFGAPAQAPAMVRMCSWCHAIADASDVWRPLESAINALPLMEPARHLGVTHGICPACVDQMFHVIDANNYHA